MHESAHEVGAQAWLTQRHSYPSLPFLLWTSADVLQMFTHAVHFLFQTTAPALCFLPACTWGHTDTVLLGLQS